ncbi:sensor histidine kinase [Paenibacillus sp.]|uniref:sensor histidine kinase n=1 Tax=Paenibacillus sp. TaxID=58172 RepID=UPI002810EB55|nr:sensor histidine kinase [Paenibacillus sp.]
MRERIVKTFGNIQTILFSTYTLIIVIVFTILVVWFYLWASDRIRSNAEDSLEGMGRSMQERIDSELGKMNDVSLNVLYSNLVKNRFQEYLGNAKQRETDAQAAANAVRAAKELADILTAAIGPSRPVEQLYLYDFEGKVYGNGFDNGEQSYRPEEMPWYDAVLAETGGKYISLPVLDEPMSRFISSREMQYSVSLYRLFYGSYNTPMGIVEVKQYFNRIFDGVIDFAETNPYGARVVIYNAAGDIVYPLRASSADFAYLAAVAAAPVGEGFRPFVDPATGDRELISVHRSGFTGWSTAIVVSESKLLAPVSVFASRTVFVGIGILLFAILLSYAAANRITHPILKIHRTIRNMSLQDLGTGRIGSSKLRSGVIEIDQLHEAFVQMNDRLKHSMDELLLSQSQELQAKLVALQSQMNPHFLYNSLATIHAMAEEGMSEQIMDMTENMSKFLRYFSSDASAVSLAEEIVHTEKYLEINRIRHGSKLDFRFDVDERLLPLEIPKLIVQPLVENALKFATRGEPPWRIVVTGFADGSRWRLEVSDNGPGFAADSLAALRERIREVDETGVIPALQLGGMGLLNIYIRLKLTYGKDMVFDIRNAPDGGAVVALGGSFREVDLTKRAEGGALA